jgi:hypothetical protein
MTANAFEPNYENEEKIIWLKDKEALRKVGWVNEKILICGIRTGPVSPPKGDVLIGYAVLKKDTVKDDERGFSRRIFTRPLQDCPSPNIGGENYSRDGVDAPCDSVPERTIDPLSAKPGKPSKMLFKPN